MQGPGGDVALHTLSMVNGGYLNSPTEDYLNPTCQRGAPPQGQLSEGPAGAGSPVQLRQKNSRFDSGVGDLEHVQIDGVAGRQTDKVARPASVKMYDYADCGHQYEELPGGRKPMVTCVTDSGIDSRSEHYQSSGGTTDIVSETGDTSGIVNSSEKRKRMNPLYDVMMQSVPSIYNKGGAKGAADALQRQVRCLRTALVVFTLLSCVALAVSIYAVVNYTGSKDDADPALTPQVQRLSSEFSKLEDILAALQGKNNTMDILADLIHQVSALQQNTTTQVGLLHGQLEAAELNITRNTQDIGLVHGEISNTLTVMNTSIQAQLDTISKMEGPQGPQGVANFSQCEYRNQSSNVPASTINSSDSPDIPKLSELEMKLAIFASCSVTGGTSVLLHTRYVSTTTVQYHCECSGTVNGVLRRFCYVHFLICPRNS